MIMLQSAAVGDESPSILTFSDQRKNQLQLFHDLQENGKTNRNLTFTCLWMTDLTGVYFYTFKPTKPAELNPVCSYKI